MHSEMDHGQVHTERITQVLERWGEVSLLEAIKEANLNEQESDTVLSIVMEKIRREAEDAGIEPAREEDPVLGIVQNLDVRQDRMDASLTEIAKYLLNLESRFQLLVTAMDGLIDAVHPESPHRAGHTEQFPRIVARAPGEAETRVVDLAARRPPKPQRGA